MRKKLQKIFRHQTQSTEAQSQQEIHKQIRFNGNYAINNFSQTKRHSLPKVPSYEQTLNFKNFFDQSKPSFRICQKVTPKSIRNFGPTQIVKQQKTIKSKISSLEEQKESFIKILEREIKVYLESDVKGAQILEKNILIVEQISNEIYSYMTVESLIKLLNSTIKTLGSKTLIFMCCCFSAQCLDLYGSYSLSIFYSDKALKLLGEKEKIYHEERQAELEIYKIITKIFLLKNQFKTAKNFGYKFLRKSWRLNNFQKQLNAYDLLGKIYHECQDKSMSIYFHERMCKGERQNSEIIKISNYELEKLERERKQFAVYESIEDFIQKDQLFHEMLQDRYKTKNRSNKMEQSQSKTQFYFHTNRSPNRNLETYRNLERRMIEEKKSKELHFIKPKQKGNLKRVISNFQKLLVEVKELFYG